MSRELGAEVVKVEQVQTSWVAKARAWPRKVLSWTIAQVKKRYQDLKNRYGPKYTKAILGIGFFTLFSPIPGSWLVSVALLVGIAEVHRAISRRGGFPEAIADLVVVVKANMPGWATGRWPSPPG
jgi:hypothetical protein